MNVDQRRIVCSAVRYLDGIMLLGPRHFDATMSIQRDKYYPDKKDSIEHEQGFIDQHGVFVTREEAYKIALAANQILRSCGGDSRNGGTLDSENLY